MAITDNLEKLLADGQDNAMIRFGLGSAYFNAGRFAEAIPHLKQCIGHDVDYSAAYKLLGKALVKEDQEEEALKVFETGLPIAIAKGDKQTEREINAFLRKLGAD